MTKTKLNILFVDDEVNIIQGLKRMLRSIREDWNFHFALSGTEALQILAQNSINVIVSDMRMPEMNGAELLAIVKDKYPSTIRIILSGQSNEALSMEVTRTAHRFISKPAEPEILKQTILQSYNLHQSLNNENLRKVINGINRLPSLPKTYLEIEKELSKENFSLQKITEIISNDMIMSAKILQIVNSAFFGLPQKISNIGQAVNIIGANTIKSLIIYVQVFKKFEENKLVENLLVSIWAHSLSVANSSKRIITKFGNNPKAKDDAYMAGLLHDIGKIVILSESSYRNSIYNLMENEQLTFNEAEVKILGTNHAEVGGYLLRLWGLSELITESVLYHHNSEKIDCQNVDIITAVYLANTFCDSQKTEINLDNINCPENVLTSVKEICE